MGSLPILIRSLSLLLSLALSLCACGRKNLSYDEEESFMEGTLANCFQEETRDREIRALWISQFDLSPICLENGKQRAEKDFTERISQLLDNVTALAELGAVNVGGATLMIMNNSTNLETTMDVLDHMIRNMLEGNYAPAESM